MYQTIVPLVGLLIIIIAISYIVINVLNSNKKWKKIADKSGLEFVGQKNMVIPNELKHFRYFSKKYSKIKLNLLIQSKEGDFRVFKYTSIRYLFRDRFRFNKKIIIYSKINKNFELTSIYKKNFKNFFSSAVSENIYGSDYLKLLIEDASNQFQIISYDKNLDKRQKIKQLSFNLENNFPFEFIEIKDNNIIFNIDFNLLNNYDDIVKRTEEIISYINKL